MGRAVSEHSLIPYRIRTERVGVQVTFLALIALIAFCALPGGEAIPWAAFVVLWILAAVGGVAALLVPWERVLAQPAGMRLLYAWSVADILLITALIWTADGHRDFFYFYALTTLFFAASYPPRGQIGLFLFTAVASAGRNMSVLGPRVVLESVVDCVVELGLEACDICLVDENDGTFRAAHSRGFPGEYTSKTYPIGTGVAGMAIESRDTVVLDDYSALSTAVPELRDLGFRAAIATPIAGDPPTAVLAGLTRHKRRLTREEIEAFELLAAQAGRALENARKFEELQATESALRAAEENLRREKDLYESLVRAQSDLGEGVLFYDGSVESVVYLNDAVSEITGYTLEELRAMPSVLTPVVPEDVPIVREQLWQLGDASRQAFEVRVVCKDLRLRTLHVALKRIGTKPPMSFIAILRDVTQQREAEKTLEVSHSILRATLESTADGILVVDSNGKMIAFNQKFVDMWKIPQEVLESRDDDRALGVVLDQLKDPDAFLSKVRMLYGSEDESFDVLEFKDGRTFERYSQPHRLDGHLVGRVWSFRDVTNRVQAERRLRDAFDALRKADAERGRLLTHLVKAKEEERRRVASEIHDDSVQVMTSVALGLERLGRRANDPEQAEALARLEARTRDAIARLRSMVFQLRPPALDEAGLDAALRLYLEELKVETGLEYELRNGLEVDPGPSARIALYRIAQEALTNVRKHAAASRVEVDLVTLEGGVGLRVRDDGVGLPRDGRAPLSPGHIGLSEMRERAEIAGGWLRVARAEPKGTVVETWIPDADPLPVMEQDAMLRRSAAATDR